MGGAATQGRAIMQLWPVRSVCVPLPASIPRAASALAPHSCSTNPPEPPLPLWPPPPHESSSSHCHNPHPGRTQHPLRPGAAASLWGVHACLCDPPNKQGCYTAPAGSLAGWLAGLFVRTAWQLQPISVMLPSQRAASWQEHSSRLDSSGRLLAHAARDAPIHPSIPFSPPPPRPYRRPHPHAHPPGPKRPRKLASTVESPVVALGTSAKSWGRALTKAPSSRSTLTS